MKIRAFIIFLYGAVVTVAKIPFILLVVILTWLLKGAIYMVHDKSVTDRTFK